MKAGRPDGKREVNVLFEEMDGVWLSMQGKGHKRMGKKEMKVFTMYEGWDAEKEKEGRMLITVIKYTKITPKKCTSDLR